MFNTICMRMSIRSYMLCICVILTPRPFLSFTFTAHCIMAAATVRWQGAVTFAVALVL